MNFRYMILAVVVLMSGLAQPQEQADPVLFIGTPCDCFYTIRGDSPQGSRELVALLAEREYRWIIVFDPMENRQSLARHLLHTQPQAEIILMQDQELAAKFRMNYAPDCCSVLELLKKDREQGWKSGF